APYFSGFRFQPVDADEVAARLVELALAKPAGLVPELGGPEVRTAKQLTRSYLTAAGKHRLTMPIRVAGNAARAMRAGANLTPDQTVGKRTWEAFLAERFS
ncbi:MAG: NAD-dependent epimerase/dehydratase family protein, partial [Actinomycetia bacterium]|nr:NAD-dependent epimerase/dehydratase family protein [Actinomycetes bacterium]